MSEPLRSKADDPAALAMRVRDAQAIGDGLPPLLIAAERVAATVAQGIHGRRRTGTGESFWQYRPYSEQDNSHSIDWRRSARSDSLFVRESEWEASQSVWLWCDGSPSMDYRSKLVRETKRDRAQLLMFATAEALLRGGERIGLLGVDGRASGGKARLRALAERFYSLADTESGLPPAANLPKHSQAILFSDFLSPIEDLEARFSEFAEQHVRGIAVQVLDPAEEELPFSGRVRFHGLEDEGHFLAEKVEQLRPGYKDRLQAHRTALRRIARASGWDLLVHHSGTSAEAGMMALFIALTEARG